MAAAGLCCSRPEEPKALMKMGLCMVLIGHVNFLLGALVHGVVLRHVSLHKQAGAMEYAISNVVALTSGLVGIIVGILAIVLSKNKKSRGLSTTLILWLPLIVTCITQMVFSAQCLAVCASFLGLPCCRNKKKPKDYGRAINVVRPMEAEAAPSRYTESPSSSSEPPSHYTEPPRRGYSQPPKPNPAPSRQQHRPPPTLQHPPRLYQSLPPSERQPLRQPHRERSDRERPETRAGSQQAAPGQHQLLERGTMERSSFWI
ncbi:transmembrane protein 54b isoform X2 [Hippoglossus hippoglossus]|uniref:transmembrane protein 54b isoform X2 n=1 Tax=Hippoglossus hippoglossus TaxID=8267 RepID=UPI00148D8805|nr:transmembrane protein 54b isoform X2 [Hippoglossus hippoglossus]